jgi:hypothetical protein
MGIAPNGVIAPGPSIGLHTGVQEQQEKGLEVAVAFSVFDAALD